MHRLLVILFLSLWVTSAHPSHAQNCGRLQPALVVAQEGRVTPGPANNLRSQPASDSSQVGSISGGEVFRVLEGPNCSNGYAWWRIDYQGTVGWTAEYDLNSTSYWLEPILDGILVQHLRPLSDFDQLRDLSAAFGGGFSSGCWFPEGFDPGSAGFLNDTLAGRPGAWLNINGIVGLSRDRISQAEGISPQGRTVTMILSNMDWLEDRNCIGIVDPALTSSPVYIASLPPTAYFYPGTWQIQLTTSRGVQTGQVQINDGSEVMTWTQWPQDDVTYAYNLQANEDLRLLAFDTEPGESLPYFVGAYTGQADSNGRIAFFNPGFEIMVGQAGSMASIGVGTNFFKINNQVYVPDQQEDLNALGRFLRGFFWR
jgi:hypothetical protein